MKRNQLAKAVAMTVLASSFAEVAHSQMLEEVVVTARKKAESIQDTPVAVSAIAGDDVEMSFTLDTTSLQAFAPNVVFDTIEMGTPGGGGFSIRGISYQDVEKSFDPTVIVAVDDVPLATGTGQVFDLIDIDRIEILRGPQGTLFGKNVVGGLINIHRTKPQLGETSGKIRLRAGEYDKWGLGGVFMTGGDTFAVKLVAQIDEQGEGYLDNGRRPDDPSTAPLADDKVWSRDQKMYSGHLLWAPNDNLTAELIVDYSKLEGSPGAVFNLDVGFSDALCAVSSLYGTPYCSGKPNEPSSGSRDRAALDGETWNMLEKTQITGRLTWDLNEDLSLSYIGSYMDSDDDQQLDGDADPYELYHFRRWGTYEQTTHEIRLSRESGSDLTWQVGAFMGNQEGWTEQNTILAGALTGVPLAPGQPFTYSQSKPESDNYSFFGEADLSLMDDRLVLTGGLRYISEEKKLTRGEYVYLFSANNGTRSSPDTADPGGFWSLPQGSGGERDSSKTIYRLGARYHFNDDIMGYATVSTGFRSGGLAPRAATPDVISKGYAPETLTNYEAGIKTTLFDQRLQFNLTAFHMIYDDMQIDLAVPAVDANGDPIGTGTQADVLNAGEAQVTGVEIDFALAVTDWWRVFGNVGFLDASYEELFVNIWADTDANLQLLPPQDETHLEMRRAPDFNYGLTSVMTFNVAGGELEWRATYSYTDAYEATITNYPVSGVDSYGILDSSLTYSRDNWRLSVFGRNLTDEDPWTHNYVVNPVRPTASNSAPGTFWRFAQRRAPSEIGAELVYEF